MRSIGITGKAGAGKDTVADMILKHLDLTKYSFAKPIYELAEHWLNLTDACYHRDLKERDMVFDLSDERFYCLDIMVYEKFKDLHVGITYESAKKVSNSIIDTLLVGHTYVNNDRDIKGAKLITSPRCILQVIGTEGFRDSLTENFWVDIAPTEEIIIPDVRFENEANYIRDNGNILIHVISDSETIQESSHASEAGIKQVEGDIIIHNTGTLYDLEVKVEGVLKDLGLI